MAVTAMRWYSGNEGAIDGHAQNNNRAKMLLVRPNAACAIAIATAKRELLVWNNWVLVLLIMFKWRKLQG